MGGSQPFGCHMLLNGKIALVTGGAKGNGAAIARGLSSEGAIVVIADIDGESAKRTQSEIQMYGVTAYAFTLDVSSAEHCASLATNVTERIGNIDILVNNAGIRPRHEFNSDQRDALWQRTMDINLNAIRTMTLAFLDSLRKTRGCVINITSIAAFNASPLSIAYSTSKAAAQMLSKVLALELAGDGIRVNAIAPGVMETEMTKSSRDDPERRERLLSRIPMARFGKPEELVGAVVFLSSDMSTYVTGTVINIDGGYLAT